MQFHYWTAHNGVHHWLTEVGNIRLCQDYKITVDTFQEDLKYPSPRTAEIFAAL